MALSMFGVCASATDVKDYPDYDKITYTEAVGVLSGLGVLEGDDTGTFRPTDTLKRSEAAKIATYLVGLQDNNVAEGTKFTDIKGHWAEEFITIAESINLVAGMGNGTFAPDGILTGYQWEKMVLCALGYSAEYENMLGDKWEGGVAILADKVDLLKDLAPTYDATKAITREEAAQIAYNALFTETVKYKLSGATHTLAKQDVTLGMKVFGLCADNVEFDVFGAPTGRVYRTVKGDVIASFAIEPIASYSNIGKGTKYVEIKEDIEDYYAKGPGAKIEYFVDGVPSTDTTVGGRGVQVDLYEFDGKFRIVEINTYVAEIGKDGVKIEKNRPNTNGNAAPDYISGLVNTAYLAAGEFKDHDVIIYNVGNEVNLDKPAKTVAVNAQTRAPERGVATTVSYNGKLDYITKNDGYVCIDKGEKTYVDVNAKLDPKVGSKIMTKVYYSYYYDTYGNVIYVAPAKYDTVSEVGHLYVIDAITYYNEYPTYENGLYFPVVNREVAAQALVVEYTDTEAEIKVVDLAIGQNAAGRYEFLDEHGFLSGVEILPGIAHNKGEIAALAASQDGGCFGRFVPDNAFAEYYVTEDGEYIIVDCDKTYEKLETKRGDADITSNGKFEADATDSTKISYLDVTYDPVEITPASIADMALKGTATVKTVVGYKNFETTGTTKAAFLHTDKDGKAAFGAMLNVSATPTTVMYAAFTGAENLDAQDGWSYNFVDSNGKPHTLYAECWEGTEWNNKTNPRPDGAVTNFGQVVFNNNADKGKVYKLYLSSENKIVAYNELENNVQANANDKDNAYYGYITFADSYIELSTEPTTADYYIADSFGGVPYGDPAVRSLNDAKMGKKWVAVYTDTFKDGPSNVERVVFVSVVADKNGSNSEDVTLTADGNGNYWFKDADGKWFGWFDGTYNTIAEKNVLATGYANYASGAVIPSDKFNLYAGRSFKLYYTDTCDVNNVRTRTFTKSVANEDGFYLYNDDNTTRTLTWVEKGVGTDMGVKAETYSYSNGDKTNWDFCNEGTLFVQVDQSGKVLDAQNIKVDNTTKAGAPVAPVHQTVKYLAYRGCSNCDNHADIVVYTIEAMS